MPEGVENKDLSRNFPKQKKKTKKIFHRSLLISNLSKFFFDGSLGTCKNAHWVLNGSPRTKTNSSISPTPPTESNETKPTACSSISRRVFSSVGSATCRKLLSFSFDLRSVGYKRRKQKEDQYHLSIELIFGGSWVRIACGVRFML
ncbi:hypothetical protein M5K25_010814 [Dendrobium thyrsiflorum]|uniref:Uncharacterized protein n=1 Tax=Dendrobium thyrsiflorum TaxID=117978 RepID=A0ABD0V1I5_DENTH